jgi:hypothetical protein
MSRAIERLNRWLSPTAVASSVEPTGGATGGGSPVNAVGVQVISTEIEHEAAGAEAEPERQAET